MYKEKNLSINWHNCKHNQTTMLTLALRFLLWPIQSNQWPSTFHGWELCFDVMFPGGSCIHNWHRENKQNNQMAASKNANNDHGITFHGIRSAQPQLHLTGKWKTRVASLKQTDWIYVVISAGIIIVCLILIHSFMTLDKQVYCTNVCSQRLSCSCWNIEQHLTTRCVLRNCLGFLFLSNWKPACAAWPQSTVTLNRNQCVKA